MMFTRLRHLLGLLTYEERVRIALSQTVGGCLGHATVVQAEHIASVVIIAARQIASGETWQCCRESEAE